VQVLITILEFLAVLAVVVLVHEFGHFATAKAFRIRVNEFGFGFPPKLLGFRKGETVYTLNLLPLGGFVKLEGENDPSQPRSLASKGVGTRFIVLVAGPFMNVVLPVLIFTILFMVPQKMVVGDVVVNEVVPNSPAALAGIEPGDIIVRANGRKIETNSDLAETIMLNLGSEMEWQVKAGPEVSSVRVVPRWNPPEGQGPTGVVIGTVNTRSVTRSEPLWEAVPHAFNKIGDVLVLMKNEVTSWIAHNKTPEVAGPIGIAQATGEVAREAGLAALIPLAALFSISLAIFNILPIPALDGGRLMFVILEWVRRGKRIPPEKEGLVHLVGFVVLIAGIVAISYRDIVRIVEDGSLLR